MSDNWDLAIQYAPYIYFDSKEPFMPVRIAVTLLKPGDASPSFNRTFQWDGEPLQAIIEYAIYWDYDIQHLYELEHVWIYVGQDGRVLDCEASFHGAYHNGMLEDRGNIEDETHVRLYSQPGKHAFRPSAADFERLPDLVSCASTDAGKQGLIITDILRGRMASTPEIDGMVERYLRTHAFIPSMKFERYKMDPRIFVRWESLWEEIPLRIQDRLRELQEAFA